MIIKLCNHYRSSGSSKLVDRLDFMFDDDDDDDDDGSSSQ